MPDTLQSGQPDAVASGRVGAICDVNENEEVTGEGLQWCAYCDQKVHESQTNSAPQTLSGYVLRATWRLSYDTWRQVCEHCQDLFKIDEHEYQPRKKFHQDNHGVIIPLLENILNDCSDTYGPRVAEKGKGVGKGSLHHWATKQTGYRTRSLALLNTKDPTELERLHYF